MTKLTGRPRGVGDDSNNQEDAHWLKATRTPDGPVDPSLLPPGPRRYDKPTPLLARPGGR